MGLQGPVGNLDEITSKGTNTSLFPGMVAETVFDLLYSLYRDNMYPVKIKGGNQND